MFYVSCSSSLGGPYRHSNVALLILCYNGLSKLKDKLKFGYVPLFPTIINLRVKIKKYFGFRHLYYKHVECFQSRQVLSSRSSNRKCFKGLRSLSCWSSRKSVEHFPSKLLNCLIVHLH